MKPRMLEFISTFVRVHRNEKSLEVYWPTPYLQEKKNLNLLYSYWEINVVGARIAYNEKAIKFKSYRCTCTQ